MKHAQPAAGTPGQGTGSETFDFKAALFGVGWLSILFGAAIQGILVILDPNSSTIPNLVRQISRTTLICMGLTLGMAALQWRAPAMGFAGLITAPCATYAAFFLHRATATMLDMSLSDTPPPAVLALAKGVEYGCLGVLTGWMGQRNKGNLIAYLLCGLLVGLVFGAIILTLTTPGVPSGMAFWTWVVNEVLFPTGCAGIVFAGNALGRRAAG